MEKACKDNYEKHLSEEEIYVHRKNEHTLFEITALGLERKRVDPTFVMGAKYYAENRTSWRPSAHSISMMKPTQGLNDPIAPGLVRAMVANKKNYLDVAHMLFYLAQSPKPNQSECCGIYKWALSLNVKNDRQLGAIMDVMRWTRHNSVENKPTDKYCVDKIIL